MDYEQKYKEALQKIRELIEIGKKKRWTIISYEKDFEEIFPELAESEDERIRKELIAVVNDLILPDEQQSRFVDWLEKQCQVKESPISQHEDKTCKENSNSLTGEDEKIRKALLNLVHDTTCNDLWDNYDVRKEKALAWLDKQGEQILANSTKTCKEIPNELEECEIEHGKYYYCIKDYYAGGNKRASKGDVVQALNGMSMMALGVKANEYFMPVNNIEQKPADKCEGCNNAKGCVACVDGSAWAHIDEKNPDAWSEEDNFMYNKIKNLLTDISLAPESRNSLFNWLKSLKQRIGG